MSEFVEKLIDNSTSGMYPMHMPGHKRRTLFFEEDDELSRIRAIDITEIDGFDNLNAPEGIIKELQERAAKVFGSPHTMILVNGSTCGVLAAISACVKHSGKLIMARNSHKCAYNAVGICGIKSAYIYPDTFEDTSLEGGITPEMVEKCIEENPDAQAVFITSPTYEGVISDVEGIASVAHDHSLPLIVDEAHGAHFGLYEPFEEKYNMRSSIKRGADIVIQSLHKTLPSFTQTALLHYRKGIIDEDRLRRAVSSYQTSSPSYILMAGVDRCLDILESRGRRLFEEYDKNLLDFHEKAKQLKHLKLQRPMKVMGSCGAVGCDIGKLVIFAPRGKGLYDTLVNECAIQPEMFGANYVLAMTSIMDNAEAFDRLYKALEKCDSMYGDSTEQENYKVRALAHSIRPESVMTISRALDGFMSDNAAKEVNADYICRSFVYAYPPGIPVIVPGELFTEEIFESLEKLRESGVNLLYR